MSAKWPSVKARKLLAALQRNGWMITQTRSSHRKLTKNGKTVVFAFHNADKIAPRMLARLAKSTGLKPTDLR